MIHPANVICQEAQRTRTEINKGQDRSGQNVCTATNYTYTPNGTTNVAAGLLNITNLGSMQKPGRGF